MVAEADRSAEDDDVEMTDVAISLAPVAVLKVEEGTAKATTTQQSDRGVQMEDAPEGLAAAVAAAAAAPVAAREEGTAAVKPEAAGVAVASVVEDGAKVKVAASSDVAGADGGTAVAGAVADAQPVGASASSSSTSSGEMVVAVTTVEKAAKSGVVAPRGLVRRDGDSGAACKMCKSKWDRDKTLVCCTCLMHYHPGCLDPPMTPREVICAV